MAVGSAQITQFHPVEGFKLGTSCAGIKNPGKKDLVVMEACAGSSIAGVFTQNAFSAAPVHICKVHLQTAQPRWLLVNTGNANAGTGKQGHQDAMATCECLAQLMNVDKSTVLPFSTGVIGEPLPLDKLLAGIPLACEQLSAHGWQEAAEGILTTDTRTKGASEIIIIHGKPVTITGIAKGSGMIRPNMATMLAFIATDAKLPQSLIHNLLGDITEQSFNRITVDGDMSTNDACMLIATGKSGVALEPQDPEWSLLYAAMVRIMQSLAQAVVRDGEGATKFISIKVNNGLHAQDCLAVAYAIAHSPLTKTALFASDPNWGRILAAIGYSGIDNLDVNQLTIHLGDVLLVENGARAASYTETQGQGVMDQEDIDITINLNRGKHQETVWTTDLSYEYVRINADYRS